MKKVLILVLFALVFSACSSTNQKRVALVIGNKNYKFKPLNNPINDARTIARRLQKLGFDVTTVNDVSQKEFAKALKTFQNKITKDTTTFFYFSGHANTLFPNSNETFFVMVDNQEEVLVSIHKLYETLRKANGKNNIICIDACQNYTKSKDKTRYTKGLYRDYTLKEETTSLPRVIDNQYSYKEPSSTIKSYSTRVNEKANDRGLHDKNLSPYAYYLNHYLDDEEIPIQEVFRRVRKGMKKDYNGLQVNFESGALDNNIWLQPKRKVTAKVNPF